MIRLIILCIVVLLIVIMIKKVSINNETYTDIEDTTDLSRYKIHKHRRYLYDPRNYLRDEKNMIKYKYSTFETNKNFLEMQYHCDYTDVISVLKYLDDEFKQSYNNIEKPISKSTNTKEELEKETKQIINHFVTLINNYIKHLPRQDTCTKYKSGWEKHQEELGLPSSIYKNNASQSKVSLVHVDSIEKSKTEYETNYICSLILKKDDVNDMMMIKVSFIMKNNTNHLVIEEIFILGFLTDEKELYDAQNKNNMSYYDYDNLNENGITDTGMILKEMIEKNKQRQQYAKDFAKNVYPNR